MIDTGTEVLKHTGQWHYVVCSVQAKSSRLRLRGNLEDAGEVMRKSKSENEVIRMWIKQSKSRREREKEAGGWTYGKREEKWVPPKETIEYEAAAGLGLLQPLSDWEFISSFAFRLHVNSCCLLWGRGWAVLPLHTWHDFLLSNCLPWIKADVCQLSFAGMSSPRWKEGRAGLNYEPRKRIQKFLWMSLKSPAERLLERDA